MIGTGAAIAGLAGLGVAAVSFGGTDAATPLQPAADTVETQTQVVSTVEHRTKRLKARQSDAGQTVISRASDDTPTTATASTTPARAATTTTTTTSDDGPNHDVGDDHGGRENEVGDDHGGDRETELGDDHGGDDNSGPGSSHSGRDDSGDDDSGHSGRDD